MTFRKGSQPIALKLRLASSYYAGRTWAALVRQAHNLKVASSNLAPATTLQRAALRPLSPRSHSVVGALPAEMKERPNPTAGSAHTSVVQRLEWTVQKQTLQ